MASRNNYFKLVSIIVDIACHVIWRYIKEKIVGPNSFQSFLDKREEKHKLVHLYETSPCCECVSEKINGEKVISRKQLLLLYKSDKTKKVRNHQKYAGGKCTQTCICDYSGIENIDVNVVDITLANFIVQKCGKHELGIDNWIEQIKEMRNEIFHLSDIQEITDEKFRRKWTTLEGSILGIAKWIDDAYAEETMRKILQTKKLTIIGDYMLKYEILCRDYWKNKLAEFERAQMQEIEKKAAVLQLSVPELSERSTVTDYKKTMKKIETLETMVDKINIMTEIFCNEDNREVFDVTDIKDEDTQIIHVPVFLQLEIPTSWDKTQVFDVIDEMRLNGTPNMNIRIKAISTDHFNILAEIAKTLLHNANELRSEINQMMSTILSYSAIVTSQESQVGVKIMILDEAGQNGTPERSNRNVESDSRVESDSTKDVTPGLNQNFDVGGTHFTQSGVNARIYNINHADLDPMMVAFDSNHRIVFEDGDIPLIQQNNGSEDGEVLMIQQNHVSEDGEVPLIQQNHVSEDGEVPLIQKNHVSEDGEVPLIQTNHVSEHKDVPLIQQNHVFEDGEVPLIQQNHVPEDGEVPLIPQNHVSEDGEVPFIQQNQENEILIIVTGLPGAGKSATANTIIGEKFFESACSHKAVTTECGMKQAQVYGRKVLVVDTPPFFDTFNGESLKIVQNEIKKYIHITAPCPYAIVFVISAAIRMNMEVIDAFTNLFSYLGKERQDHAIIVFTHADVLEMERFDLDLYLQSLSKGFKEFLSSCGNRYLAFNNRLEMEERKKQATKLLEKIESLKFEDSGKKQAKNLLEKNESLKFEDYGQKHLDKCEIM